MITEETKICEEYIHERLLEEFAKIRSLFSIKTSAFFVNHRFFHDFRIKNILIEEQNEKKRTTNVEMILFDLDEVLDKKYKITLGDVEKINLVFNNLIIVKSNDGFDSVYYNKMNYVDKRYVFNCYFTSKSYLYIKSKKISIKTCPKKSLG